MMRMGMVALACVGSFLLAATLSAQEAKRDDATKAESKTAALYRATGLRGMKVYNNKSEQLGSINDLAINMRDGSIVYAALSYGGVAGIGDKLFAVPWNAMRLQENENNTWLVLNLDKSRLDAAAGFNQDKWPTEADKTFLDAAPPSDKGKVGEAIEGAKEKVKEAARDVADAATKTDIQRSSSVVGIKVTNGQAEDLGRISDLVFEPKGNLKYAVLTYGGVAGIGGKMFAVPWNTLKLESSTLKPNERSFVLNVQKNTLEQATGFDSKNWPRDPDAQMFKAPERR